MCLCVKFTRTQYCNTSILKYCFELSHFSYKTEISHISISFCNVCEKCSAPLIYNYTNYSAVIAIMSKSKITTFNWQMKNILTQSPLTCFFQSFELELMVFISQWSMLSCHHMNKVWKDITPLNWSSIEVTGWQSSQPHPLMKTTRCSWKLKLLNGPWVSKLFYQTIWMNFYVLLNNISTVSILVEDIYIHRYLVRRSLWCMSVVRPPWLHRKKHF